MPPPLVIWRITDGKPGHENQTLGVARALGDLAQVDTHSIAAPGRAEAIGFLLRRSFPPALALPDPDLILCAGHATHLGALAARRARGGRLVALMRPSLPLRWFDGCVIPLHDAPPDRTGVLATRGAANNVLPSPNKDDAIGFILVGGPSRHHTWDDAGVVRQIESIFTRDTTRRWTLTTSRRTPETFAAAVEPLSRRGLEVVPFAQTTREWMRERFDEAGAIWVTQDSVSMVYEALTSGARVGLLRVASARGGRVERGLAALERDGWATSFEAWERTGSLAPAPDRLDEAARVARWIMDSVLARAQAAAEGP